MHVNKNIINNNNNNKILSTFNFSSPWLSWLAITVLMAISFILYMVPLRWLILAWGINKFTKKFRKPPDFVDNTEILDFLSRVPSRKEQFEYKEIKLNGGLTPSNSLSGRSSPQDTSKKKKKA